MPTFDELQEARVVIGQAGIAATGITAGEKLDITSRLAALETIAVPPRQAVMGNRYYGPLSSVSGPLTHDVLNPDANRMYAGAFSVPQDAAFNQVSVIVTTSAGSGATARFGLYDWQANGLPGNLVIDLGTVDVSATGLRANAITVTIPRGRYWFAGAFNLQTVYEAVTVQLGSEAVLGHFDTTGNTPRSALWRTTLLASGFTTLPSTFGSVTTSFYIPKFWLRAA